MDQPVLNARRDTTTGNSFVNGCSQRRTRNGGTRDFLQGKLFEIFQLI
jgi:hypothetical protein